MIRLKALILRYGSKFVSRLWIRPAIYCVSAIAIVVIAATIDRYLPSPANIYVGAGLIEGLLGIMASSMLVVVTFSVSVLIAGYINATGTASPRAFDMVIADSPTKQALSSFVGAFIFSVIGYVGIGTGLIEKSGRLLLMVMTIGIFLWVVGTLVYWIDHVARIGQVRNTIGKVARRAQRELAAVLAKPATGPSGQPAGGASCPVYPNRAGVVQDISLSSLAACAEAIGAPIHVAAPCGAVAGPADPLCHVGAEGLTADQIAAIRSCFLIGRMGRPRGNAVLSLRTLSEIASRSLSPGINDPGTAIDVLNTLTAVFDGAARKAGRIEPAKSNGIVTLPPPDPQDLIGAAFEAVGRDGAALVEVATALQETLRVAADILPARYREAIELQSARALDHACARLAFDWERERVKAAAQAVGGRCAESRNRAVMQSQPAP